jgi:predicted ArsR family transcriptional regulator
MNERPAVTDQIAALLRAQGPMTMSAIAAKLDRNSGGIRVRLHRMVRTGRLVASEGPNRWTVYAVPDEKEEGS